MPNHQMQPVSARIESLATKRGSDPAIVYAPCTGPELRLTFADVHERASALAHVLAGHGAEPGTLVVIALPPHPDHLALAIAAWRLGACVLPLSHRMPPAERAALLDLASTEWASIVTVGPPANGFDPSLPFTPGQSVAQSRRPLPHLSPSPERAIASGGTTGTPKICITAHEGLVELVDSAMQLDPGTRALGLRAGMTQLVCTPLYHTAGFNWSHLSLRAGNTLVLTDRFDAGHVIDLVERHRVNHSMVVPEIMRRLLAVPGLEQRDLSSWRSFAHGGAPCPGWLKQRWMELLGPAHVIEGYGATEGTGMAAVTGDQWQKRPGTVGRPVACDVVIVDDEGAPLPPGEVGEILMRPHGAGPTFRYVGSSYSRTVGDGFLGLGDHGWVDRDGYLYVADRRTDLVISGGANIYPAEVEAVLSEHHAVAEVAVVGLPDPDWGRRVHAVLVLGSESEPPTDEQLRAFCLGRLASYKVPKSFAVTTALARTELGKVQRGQVLASELRRLGLQEGQ